MRDSHDFERLEHRLLLYGGPPTVDSLATATESHLESAAYLSPLELAGTEVPALDLAARESSSLQPRLESTYLEPSNSDAIVARSHDDLCNAGDRIVLTAVTISSSCTVTGSLTVHGGGRLIANFTGDPNAVLRVEGDVSVGGSGILRVEGGTFEVQQDFNRHREMWTTDDAIVVFRGTEVVLNQDAGSKYMVYNAFDNSQMIVADSHIDRSSSWLVANQFGYSDLLVVHSNHLPTEIYLKEGSTVKIGSESQTGIWLNLTENSRGTINLPRQTDASGDHVPYSWAIGRDRPGLLGIQWQLEISESLVGIGIESRSNSAIAVNGQGFPDSGELTVSYHVDSGISELRNLGVGLQNRSLGGGQLILHNVQLGPIAWQIYAHENEMLTIHDSILNEVGVSASGHISVRDSIFQFAGITSLGSGAASIDVFHSQIFSQTIQAVGDGVVNIHDSAVFGAVVVSHESTSEVNFHGGAFLTNSTEACALNLDVMLDSRGVPNCNPFLAPGAAVTKTGLGITTCDGTYNCDWQVESQQRLLQQGTMQPLLQGEFRGSRSNRGAASEPAMIGRRTPTTEKLTAKSTTWHLAATSMEQMTFSVLSWIGDLSRDSFSFKDYVQEVDDPSWGLHFLGK